MTEQKLAESISLAQKILEKSRRKALEESTRVAREEAKRKEYEYSKIEEKLVLSEDIFNWGRSFLESENYRRIVELIKQRPYFLAGSDPEKLWIYSGDYSRFYMGTDCTFAHCHVAKFSLGSLRLFRIPEELCQLSYKYLSDLNDFLSEDKIYEKLAGP